MDQAQNILKALTLAQRAALAGVLVAVFGGILLVSMVAGQTHYKVVCRDLDGKSAGDVTAKLAEWKIPYRLENEGTAVSVPDAQADEARVKITAEDLVHTGSIGFELFDKTNFGATDFTQQVNYQRALQGELAKTIAGIDDVASARVLIAIPEKRLFSDKEEPTTASVQLQLKQSHSLNERQVGGIVRLVSGAVKGLQPDNVTVLDGAGNLLSHRHTEGEMTGDQAEFQQQYERRLSSELNQIAERIVGAGKAMVSVRAEFNWDQTETTSETYKPAGTNGGDLTTQQQTDYERYSGKKPDSDATTPPTTPAPNGTASGTPGAASNMGNGNGTNGADEKKDDADSENAKGRLYDKTRKDVNYAVNKVVEKKVVAPGKLRRVNVAVLLDQTAGAQGAALKNAFAAAAGLDTRTAAQGGREDHIELVATAFDKSAQQQAEKATKDEVKQTQQNTMIRTGGAVAIVVLLFIASIVLLKLMRPARAKTAAPALEAADPAGATAGTTVAAAFEGAPAGGQLDVVLGAGESSTGDPLSQLGYQPESQEEFDDLVGAPHGSRTRERLVRLAQDRPEDVARQLQIWMSE